MKRMIIILIVSLILATGVGLSLVYGGDRMSNASKDASKDVTTPLDVNEDNTDDAVTTKKYPLEDYLKTVSREEYIEYVKQQMQTQSYQDYLNYVRRYDPDYDPLNIPEIPGMKYVIQVDDGGVLRESYYSKYFTGKYVSDPQAELDNIPYYSYEKLLFNKRIDTFKLGMDSSREEYGNHSSIIGYLQRECPSEVMRERPDGSRYMVYDTENNTRFYLMLSPDNPYPLAVGFPVIYRNKLSYSDFADIEPGDTLSEVSKIDDICELYLREWFDFMNIDKTSFETVDERCPEWFSTIHYLSDGLLKIEYDKLNDDGVPLIKTVTLYPDYIMETFTGKKLNYRINQLDLP